ncbi:hypothetical protein AX16_007441 [Volvariella volvacea WC 439]|nr:hypothetical protein AX16_007441 [Volvariella volvacea WC 439]
MASQLRRYYLLLCSLLVVKLSLASAPAGTQHVLDHPNPFQHHFRINQEPVPDNFAWDSIKPAKDLRWHSCYAGFQCARLLVPLNYSEPHGRQATIALTRLPSRFPPDSPQYRGPVLFNPGGPGGGGVDFAVLSGDLLSRIIGPQFDVVGFDPRGIGRSVPRGEFFKDSAERVIWAEDIQTSLDATDDGVTRAWARARIGGELAYKRSWDIIPHIHTDNTARDMLEIVKAHGQDKLQYWGFSYGSVLGATFAAMFPDNVGRVIIDGVVDLENYYAALWSNNLMDADKVQQSFFDGCYEAGPIDCPFWAHSSEAIASNLTALYDKLRVDPIPVITSRSYGLVDYSLLRVIVFRSLYSPYAFFKRLASALADLANGDGRTVYELLEVPTYQCPCNSASDPWTTVLNEGIFYVACTDGDPVPSDLESTKKYYEESLKEYEWATLWANIRIGCVGWPKFERTNFQGPFVGNTSHPLLLIGNTADPVTPLWAARKVAKGFKGSVVLTQDSGGHCSISTPSLCTAKYIRNYMLNGTLPDSGTICPVDVSPWETKPKNLYSLTAEDQELMGVLHELSYSHRSGFPL